MAVKSDIVTIWSMRIGATPAPEQLALWRDVLSADELAQADTSYGAGARQSSIAAHALLRGLLQAIEGQPARDSRFALTQAGKPVLLGEPGRRLPHCSLTHTDALVACAVSIEFPIGIDAEPCSRTASPAVLATVLAPAESALIDALSAERRSEAFLQLWTLREAYLKAAGGGLHFPHEAFSFKLDPPQITFEEGVPEADPVNWQFHTWLAERHVLSLAVSSHRATRLTFVKRAVTPDELTCALEYGGKIDSTLPARNRSPPQFVVRID